MADEREAGWDMDWPDEADLWEAYYGALGMLVQMFGRIEVELHSVLKFMIYDFSKMSDDLTPWEIIDALAGSMRVAPLRDSIKRVLRIVRANEDIIAGFEYAFKQLGDIHFFRDRIVHHGSEISVFNKGQFYTSNDKTDREYMQQDMILFTVENLLDMAYDLKEMHYYIGELGNELTIFSKNEIEYEFTDDLRRPAWRYRSSQLTMEGPKHWSKPLARSRPQKSSQAKQAEDDQA